SCSRTRFHKRGNRPPNAGRNNWLHVVGGLRPAAVLLSLAPPSGGTGSIRGPAVSTFWPSCRRTARGPTWLVYSRIGGIGPPSARGRFRVEPLPPGRPEYLPPERALLLLVALLALGLLRHPRGVEGDHRPD